VPVVLAADGVVELSILAIAIALILLRRVWVSTFGHLLLELAKPFDHAGFTINLGFRKIKLGLQWVATILRGLNAAALHLLGAGIDATDYAAKRLWHWTAYMLESVGRVVGDLAEQVEQELSYLWRQSIPRYVHAALHPLASKVEWLIHYVEHTVAHPTTIVRPVTRVLDPRIASLEREVKRLAATVEADGAAVLAPPIAVPFPHVGDVLHGIDALRARLGKLTRQLAPAAVAALVVAALGSLRLGWLKCGNVARFGRHVCGMDGDLLDTLLADTVLVFGTVSLVEFASEMTNLQDEIAGAVRRFWRV
jgi:hypothetical protein